MLTLLSFIQFGYIAAFECCHQKYGFRWRWWAALLAAGMLAVGGLAALAWHLRRESPREAVFILMLLAFAGVLGYWAFTGRFPFQ